MKTFLKLLFLILFSPLIAIALMAYAVVSFAKSLK